MTALVSPRTSWRPCRGREPDRLHTSSGCPPPFASLVERKQLNKGNKERVRVGAAGERRSADVMKIVVKNDLLSQGLRVLI